LPKGICIVSSFILLVKNSVKIEYVANIAVKIIANFIERMEAHALALSAAQYGKVGLGYAHHRAKLLAGYAAALQHFVQIYLYRHKLTLNNAVVIVLNALGFGNEAAEYEREQGEKHTGKGDACGNVNVAQSARKRYLHGIERGAAYYGYFQADNGKPAQPLRGIHGRITEHAAAHG
jgi:hypothetical protein